MTEKKLTDEEIIKALECCEGEGSCKNCPFNKNTDDCASLGKYSLDLINRQKAEIERLQGRLKAVETSKQKLLDCFKSAGDIAIKKFAERVFELFPADKNHTTISKFTIKQIEKEMAGGE